MKEWPIVITMRNDRGWELSGIRAQALLLSIVPLSFLVLLLVLAGILQNKTEQTAAWSARASPKRGLHRSCGPAC